MSSAADEEVCPLCFSIAERDYLADNIYVYHGPKTIGAIADRNNDKLSTDEKQAIKEEINPRYKET